MIDRGRFSQVPRASNPSPCMGLGVWGGGRGTYKASGSPPLIPVLIFRPRADPGSRAKAGQDEEAQEKEVA
jgi:hypothetical protein